MLMRRKRNAKPPLGSYRLSRNRTRGLRVESLEARSMLAGVVNVITMPAGTLTLEGDGSNNQVELRQTVNPNEFQLTGSNGTLFRLNGLAPTYVSLPPIAGITGSIVVDLLDGDDTFKFEGVSAGIASSAPADLYIYNADGHDENSLTDVLVNGNLVVHKYAVSSGYSGLEIKNSSVNGDTIVSNVGNGFGDTKTVIDNSKLEGSGVAAALSIYNPYGNNIVEVRPNTQLGRGGFVGAQPVVYISNLGGGSRTTFTGANQIAGPGTTTVYGAVEINNGDNPLNTVDIVTFNLVNVLGEVQLTNNEGSTQTMLLDSTLGSDFNAPPVGTGGSVTLLNDGGFDSLTVTNSTIPWGMYVDNDFANFHASTWGSSTQISGSVIGRTPPGPSLPIPGDALVILGDNGADVVNIQTTSVGGTLDLQLFNGNNSITLLNNTATLDSLKIVTGSGSDTLTIDNTRILANIYIRLNAGADTMRILNENYATQWPNPLLTVIDIDAGVGVMGGVDTFVGTLPPADVLTGFDFFLP